MSPIQLISRDACMAAIFTPESRPCVRTWEVWKARRMIPYVKLGRLVYYNEAAVREALSTRFSVNVKGAAA